MLVNLIMPHLRQGSHCCFPVLALLTLGFSLALSNEKNAI
jgi:hypothetical protein